MNVGAVNNYSASFGNKNKNGANPDFVVTKPGTVEIPLPGLNRPASEDVKKAIKTQKNLGYAGLGAAVLGFAGAFMKNKFVKSLMIIPSFVITAAAGLLFYASAQKAEQVATKLADTGIVENTKITETKTETEKATTTEQSK